MGCLFPTVACQKNIPVLLIKPSIAAKRKERERDGKFVMDDNGRQIRSKHGDQQVVLGSCLRGTLCLIYKTIKKLHIQYQILHIAKYKSVFREYTMLVAWHDGLSNLENASVPSLHPAFQSALFMP